MYFKHKKIYNVGLVEPIYYVCYIRYDNQYICIEG